MYIFACGTKRDCLIRMPNIYDGFFRFIASNVISDRFFFFNKKLVASHKTPLGTVFPPITTPGAYLIFKIEGVRRAE